MWQDDRASRDLGMILRAISPGRAAMTMVVRDDMVNGHGICHGGFIFTLADSAFAFACNSYGERDVAQHNTITLPAARTIGRNPDGNRRGARAVRPQRHLRRTCHRLGRNRGGRNARPFTHDRTEIFRGGLNGRAGPDRNRLT
jgi:phenylacetic acid degradation protein PaaD